MEAPKAKELASGEELKEETAKIIFPFSAL